MKIHRLTLLLAAALAVVSARAQETDEAERLPAGTLAVEEAGRLLATGRAAYEDGLYRLAQRRLEELVAGAPDKRRQTEGALWLGRTLLAAQKPEAALGVLENYRGQVRAAALSAEYALTVAQGRFELGRLPEATAELEGFQDRQLAQDAAPAALRLLARIQAAQGSWAAARDTCARLETRQPEGAVAPTAWLELAAAAAAAGQAPEADAALEHLQTKYAGQIWAERAALEAIALRWQAGAKPPVLPQLREMAANTNLQAETRAQACQFAAEVLGAESNFNAALEMGAQGGALAATPAQRLAGEVLQARLLLRAGRVEEGAQRMRAAALQVPDETRSAQIQRELADELAQLGHWRAAAAEYQAWLDAFDGAAGTPEVLAGLGWALLSDGRPAEAAPAFERAAAAEPDPARRLPLLQKQADALFASRQHSKAQTTYAAVLAAAPAGGELAGRAQLQMAETELALGATEAGEVRLLDLSRAKQESDFSRAATLRLGALYEERGALETAMEQYGKLIASCAEPESCARALLARGLVRYRMGSFQPAMEDFQRIRTQFAQTRPAAQAMFMGGWCLYMLGKDAEALQVCEQFLAEYSGSEFAPDVRYWLGEHAFNRGDYEPAEALFARVAADHPASPRAADALYWAGRAATARRAYLAANEHYNALMAGYPDSSRMAATLLAQGDVLSELGQFSAAILAFGEVIVKFPQAPEALAAWGRKGDCQYTLGQENPARYEEALLSYRTLLDFAGAPVDLRLQAGFKVARCLEKMGRAAAALDRYMEVVYAYRQAERPPSEAAVWFTRAAFAAAALQERTGGWKEAFGIYKRVAESGIPAAAEARDRMERIRQEHWTLF